jgi:uncharacterized protein DUF11
VSWDTTAATDGSHTVTATARDAAGHSTSASATVTVNNAPPPPAPPSPPPSSGGGGSSGIPPDLHLDATATSTTAPGVGAELDFTITVSSKNTGGASDATLQVTLPAGYAVTSTYADRGPGCSSAPPTLRCDVAFINPSASTHVRITGTVGQAGEQDLTAVVTGFPEPELDPSDNTITVKLPAAAPPPAGSPTPTLVSAPVVKAAAKVNTTVRATAPKWSGVAAHVLYQWQLCTKISCKAITGATTLTLRIRPAYAGKTVRIAASAEIDGQRLRVYSRKIAIRR